MNKPKQPTRSPAAPGPKPDLLKIKGNAGGNQEIAGQEEASGGLAEVISASVTAPYFFMRPCVHTSDRF